MEGQQQFAPTGGMASIGLPWRLLLFSLFLFVFAIFIYLGLGFGYGTYLDTRAKSLDKDLQELTAQVAEGDLDGLVGFYSQLINAETVLGRHSFTFNVFRFLEGRTHPNVYFVSAGFSEDGSKLVLQGRGGTMKDVVEQLALFDSAPQVSAVTLGQVGLGNLEVDFGITLSMKKDFFEKPF